jgi:hypothetical protein
VHLATRSLDEGAPASWADQLNRQYDDLEAALHWLTDRSEVDGAQLIGAALSNVWRQRGLVAEGRLIMARLLQLTGDAQRSRSRASLLLAAGLLASLQGDFTMARSLLQESVNILSCLANPRELPLALAYLADLDIVRGDWAAGRLQVERGLAASSLLADAWAERLAHVTRGEGDSEAADTLVNRALPTLRAAGAKRMVAAGLQFLAEGASRRGEYAESRRLLEDSLAGSSGLRSPSPLSDGELCGAWRPASSATTGARAPAQSAP